MSRQKNKGNVRAYHRAYRLNNKHRLNTKRQKRMERLKSPATDTDKKRLSEIAQYDPVNCDSSGSLPTEPAQTLKTEEIEIKNRAQVGLGGLQMKQSPEISVKSEDKLKISLDAIPEERKEEKQRETKPIAEIPEEKKLKRTKPKSQPKREIKSGIRRIIERRLGGRKRRDRTKRKAQGKQSEQQEKKKVELKSEETETVPKKEEE